MCNSPEITILPSQISPICVIVRVRVRLVRVDKVVRVSVVRVMVTLTRVHSSKVLKWQSFSDTVATLRYRAARAAKKLFGIKLFATIQSPHKCPFVPRLSSF